MHAVYLDADRITLTLDDGEALATVAGPGEFILSVIPGLLVYDALVETGLPIAPAPLVATGSALRIALKAAGLHRAWQAVLAEQSQDTRDWWASRYDRAIPVSATKLVRIAGACDPPVDLISLYAAAATVA